MSDDQVLDLSIFLNNYLNDSREGFQEISDALLALEKDHGRIQVVDEIFRAVHTLKSSSAMLKFTDIAESAHACEDLLDQMRKGAMPVTQKIINLLFKVTDTLKTMVNQRAPEAAGKEHVNSQKIVKNLKSLIKKTRAAVQAPEEERAADPENGAEEREAPEAPRAGEPKAAHGIERIKTVRVHVDVLDILFDMAGELIITKNRIDNLMSVTIGKALKKSMAALDRMIREMQETISAARLVPVDEIFRQFPRMVRDLSREKGKEVELILEGHEIELDKSVLDAMGDPLIHLIRNAVDHGIERTEVRLKHNKPRTGFIRIAARRAENHIIVEVEDDGCGVDLAKVSELAESSGLIQPEKSGSMKENDLINLIFQPGFSTNKEVTGLSGRGVGLDVVKVAVEKLGGTVDVTTKPGMGTLFTLTLPMATAIMQTLLVGVGDHVFVIPSDIVVETLEIKPGLLKKVKDSQVLNLRGKVIPFFWLDEVMNISVSRERKGFLAIIVNRGDSFLGVGVDTVFDQMENIIKPFDPIARRFKGLSGGTILGDGRVALMVDLMALFGSKTLWGERHIT